jgi:hypothetical protein
MIVAAEDEPVRHSNEIAAVRLRAPHHVHVVPDASRGFEEPGALNDVLHLTCSWFAAHLAMPGAERRQVSHGQIAAAGAFSHVATATVTKIA